jgi:hypothetical protein
MKSKLSKLLGIALTIALLTSLLVVATPASALSTPSVTVGTPKISQASAYTIRFSIDKALDTVGDTITITFPTGTTVAAPTATITAGPGWITGGTAWGGPTWGGGGAFALGAAGTNSIVYTLVAGDEIGESAEVRVNVTGGITNPAAPGTYQLTVKTSKEVVAVSSNSYSITEPTINPLPGIVLAKNAAGILMGQFNSIKDAIETAGIGGRIEVGPGYYDDETASTVDPANNPAGPIIARHAGQTIIATGEPGTVVIKNVTSAGGGGEIQVTAVGTVTSPVVIDGLTFETPVAAGVPANMIDITAAARYITVQNCVITPGGTSGVNVAGGAANIKIMNNTINTVALKGHTAIVNNGKTTISGNTINVAATCTGIANDDPNAPAATSALAPVVISGNTITGASGTGITTANTSAAGAAGYVSLTNNTLTGLNQALTVTDGTVTATGNTFDACGAAVPVTHAIAVAANGNLKLKENTIKNTTATGAYAISNAGNLTARFNNITGNTKNVLGTGAVVTTIDHNWWGATTGAAAGSVVGATATFPLGATSSSGTYTTGANALTAQTTVGIDVAVLKNGAPHTAASGDMIGVSKLDECPVSTTPAIAGAGGVKGYYDIYFIDGGNGADKLQIKIYGDVGPYTKVYYSGGLTGAWIECSDSGVNAAAGYAYIIVQAGTSPSLAEMTGTPFALVEDKTVAAPNISAAAGGNPVIGAYDISIEPMFTWQAVPGAIRYELAICEDPTFAVIERNYAPEQPFVKVEEALRYSTTYYWRVRGVLGEPEGSGATRVTPATPWTVGIFTTMDEPVEAGEAVVVEPTAPEVTVDVAPTEVTIQPSSPAIPTYMLWVIVAVGAVLIIALIILIVRTRRVV